MSFQVLSAISCGFVFGLYLVAKCRALQSVPTIFLPLAYVWIHEKFLFEIFCERTNSHLGKIELRSNGTLFYSGGREKRTNSMIFWNIGDFHLVEDRSKLIYKWLSFLSGDFLIWENRYYSTNAGRYFSRRRFSQSLVLWP